MREKLTQLTSIDAEIQQIKDYALAEDSVYSSMTEDGIEIYKLQIKSAILAIDGHVSTMAAEISNANVSAQTVETQANANKTTATTAQEKASVVL